MWPVRPRVVAHGEQQAEQEVERQEADGDETGVAREIDGAHASMEAEVEVEVAARGAGTLSEHTPRWRIVLRAQAGGRLVRSAWTRGAKCGKVGAMQSRTLLRRSGVAHGAAVAAACITIAAPAAAQRPVLSANVRQYVAVDTPVVALTHVRVIDGTGAAPRENQTLIIRDGRIAALGDAAATP